MGHRLGWPCRHSFEGEPEPVDFERGSYAGTFLPMWNIGLRGSTRVEKTVWLAIHYKD